MTAASTTSNTSRAFRVAPEKAPPMSGGPRPHAPARHHTTLCTQCFEPDWMDDEDAQLRRLDALNRRRQRGVMRAYMGLLIVALLAYAPIAITHVATAITLASAGGGQ